jgi:Asp-tRNA(Asn)/Glu-tRNA(Gln) amidotransferase B subunit
MTDDLIEQMNRTHMYLPEDEFRMVMEGFNASEKDVHILRKATQRYKRYKYHIDLSFHPLLNSLIDSFLEFPSFEKMKTIDTTIVTLLKS